MIIIKKNNLLLFRNKFYRCSLGESGLTTNKIEGDKCTPVGSFNLGKLYIRTDRIKNLKTKFNYIPIKKTMTWSDDPNSKKYNKLVFTNKYKTEKMFRHDNLYDLVLIIKYNMLPTIPHKGSAIFLHVTSENYYPTRGCIAITINDFREILINLKPSDKIKISNY